ncbi:MAG: addiction module protein [Terrimicrobiaceae bacterium]
MQEIFPRGANSAHPQPPLAKVWRDIGPDVRAVAERIELNLAPSPRMAYAIRMSIAELRQLPRKEKLQILETLWTDLATDDALVESPSWHAEELQKTEEDLKAGKIEVVLGISKERPQKAI